MTDFADYFPHADVLDALGDTVTYNGTDIKGEIDINAQRIGADGYTVERFTRLQVLLADVPSPAKNDSVVYKTVNYKVAQIEDISSHYADLILVRIV